MPNDPSDLSDIESRLRGYQHRQPSYARRAQPNFSREISDFVAKPSLVPTTKPSHPPVAFKPETVPIQPGKVPVHHQENGRQQQAPTKPRGFNLPSLQGAAMLVALVALFVVSVGFGNRSLNSASPSQSTHTLAATDTTKSELTPPTEVGGPQNLKISQINLNLKLSQLTTGFSSPDVNQAGWLPSSAKLTDANGAVVIIGGNVLSDLKKLQVGDTVTLEDASGISYSYEVSMTRVYDPKAIDTQKVLAPIDSGAGLNLVAYNTAVNGQQTVLVVFTMRK